MFMSGPKFFGQFLKVAIEREVSSLICAANEANLDVTQYEVAGEGECFFK